MMRYTDTQNQPNSMPCDRKLSPSLKTSFFVLFLWLSTSTVGRNRDAGCHKNKKSDARSHATFSCFDIIGRYDLRLTQMPAQHVKPVPVFQRECVRARWSSAGMVYMWYLYIPERRMQEQGAPY